MIIKIIGNNSSNIRKTNVLITTIISYNIVDKYVLNRCTNNCNMKKKM